MARKTQKQDPALTEMLVTMIMQQSGMTREQAEVQAAKEVSNAAASMKTPVGRAFRKEDGFRD